MEAWGCETVEYSKEQIQQLTKTLKENNWRMSVGLGVAQQFIFGNRLDAETIVRLMENIIRVRDGERNVWTVVTLESSKDGLECVGTLVKAQQPETWVREALGLA